MHDSTSELRIRSPPLQGQAIHAWHPNLHQGVPVPMPNNAGSGHRRLTGSRSQESTRIESEAANGYPPLLGRGRSCGSFAARLGIRLPRPPRSETKLFRTSSCGSGIPLLRPIGSLEPLLCCAEGVVGAPRLLSRAVVGPVLRSLGRGAACSADGPRRWWCCGRHASGHQQRLNYTMAHAARSYGHRADKTSHTTSMSMYDPDCPPRGMAIESAKYCTLKLR